MIPQLINRYKRMRTERFLRQTYQYQYAFVGMGQHSLTNLYPVLHYLGVPLKYICVTSERKARLIEQKFPGVKATTSLCEILNDRDVRGIFVSASPSVHFSIASQVLRSGKSLFIEKPPCQSLEELDKLIDLQRLYGSPIAMVGLQKRYAPAVQMLKKHLNKEHLINYDLHYLTGAYPERLRVGERSSGMGGALLDLYIHPLDLVCFLFGKPEILVCRKVANDSYILMLQHPHIVGILELSTAYTWTAAEETLKICTRSGIYHLSQMELLTYTPKRSAPLGIPIEKLCRTNKTTEHLYDRNNFVPTLVNNQVYSQGFFHELSSFVNAVERRSYDILTDLCSLRDVYELLARIKESAP